MIQKSGVTLDRKRIEHIPADSNVKPTGDRIWVKPLQGITSSIIHVVHAGRALRGTIVAVGPGRWEKKYLKNSKGEVYKVVETGRFIPTEVRVGDVVELGGKEHEGYNFPTVMWGLDLCVMCQEQDVCFVDEEKSAA